MLNPFHLAFNVNNIEEARAFYGSILSCTEGRSSEKWIDYSFFGHQISLHLGEPFVTRLTGKVEGKLVPMPHLGVILAIDDWRILANRLKELNVDFVIEPSLRFVGEAGEQATMFFCDPSGNPIEIKGFANLDKVFSS